MNVVKNLYNLLNRRFFFCLILSNNVLQIINSQNIRCLVKRNSFNNEKKTFCNKWISKPHGNGSFPFFCPLIDKNEFSSSSGILIIYWWSAKSLGNYYQVRQHHVIVYRVGHRPTDVKSFSRKSPDVHSVRNVR